MDPIVNPQIKVYKLRINDVIKCARFSVTIVRHELKFL